YLAEGGDANLDACARLLELAPNAEDVTLLVAGFEKALEGRKSVTVTPRLRAQLEAVAPKQADNPAFMRLMLRLGSGEALNSALRRVADVAAPERERVALLAGLAQIAKPEAVPVLLKLLADPKEPVRAAALAALQPFPDPAVAEAVLAAYPKLSPTLRGKAQALLAGRPASSLALLKAVDAGRIPAKDVPLETVRLLAGRQGAEGDA